jgi:hypothetical protein
VHAIKAQKLWSGVLLISFLCAGCTGIKAPCRTSEKRAVYVPETGGLIDVIPLALSFRDLEKEYVHPGFTKQVVAWGPYGFEWRVHPASEKNAFAAIKLRSSYDFQAKRDCYAFRFRMKPIGAMKHLALGLLDGDKQEPFVVVQFNKIPKQERVWNEWGFFSIPLNTFSDRGVLFENGRLVPEQVDFDWSDVTGIVLLCTDSHDWLVPVSFRDLRFENVRMIQ